MYDFFDMWKRGTGALNSEPSVLCSKFSMPRAYRSAPVGNYEQASLCQIPGLCLEFFTGTK